MNDINRSGEHHAADYEIGSMSAKVSHLEKTTDEIKAEQTRMWETLTANTSLLHKIDKGVDRMADVPMAVDNHTHELEELDGRVDRLEEKTNTARTSKNKRKNALQQPTGEWLGNMLMTSLTKLGQAIIFAILVGGIIAVANAFMGSDDPVYLPMPYEDPTFNPEDLVPGSALEE